MKKRIEKFVCSACEGDGWITGCEGDNKKTKRDNFVIKDCDACNGKGYVFIEVIDKRIITAKKKAEYLKKY